METHTRAMIAAAAFAHVTGKPVAGIYDHAAGRDRKIAAEFRGSRLQGHDGDHAVTFGGSIPELYNGENNNFISFDAQGAIVKGYDRESSSFYEAHVSDGVVQLFDHSQSAWFAYDIQDAGAASSYHRGSEIRR